MLLRTAAAAALSGVCVATVFAAFFSYCVVNMEGGALLVWTAVTLTLRTHSDLALSRPIKHKQDKTKAKYEAHVGGSGGVLMVHESQRTNTQAHGNKQSYCITHPHFFSSFSHFKTPMFY